AEFGEADAEGLADAVQAAQWKIAAAEIALHRRLADTEVTGEFAIGHAARAQPGADRFEQQFRLGHGVSLRKAGAGYQPPMPIRSRRATPTTGPCRCAAAPRRLRPPRCTDPPMSRPLS